MLLDGSNLFFRAHHAFQKVEERGDIEGLNGCGATYGFVRSVLSFHREDCAYFGVVFDVWGGPRSSGKECLRHQKFPGYKANREETPGIAEQWAMAKDACDMLGVFRTELRGYEADDVIATYAQQAREEGCSATIVSVDKDFHQLIQDPSVEVLVPGKNERWDEEAVRRHWGVEPRQVLDLLALAGDVSDNIPGVPQIGPKMAAALVRRYGDLEGVLRAAAEPATFRVPGVGPKRQAGLLEFADRARDARELMELKPLLGVQLPGLQALRKKPIDIEGCSMWCVNRCHALYRYLKRYGESISA